MPESIYIYGDIGESFWDDSGITDVSIRDQLSALPRTDLLEVRINSMGGQTNHGAAIFNLFMSYKAKQKAINDSFQLHTVVDGFAYSAASIIMLAGDKRIMNSGSRAMIHNPWSFIQGDYREAQKVAEYLKLAKDSSAQMYADITGKKIETISQLMDDETYFLPQDAIDIGLATELGNQLTMSRKDPYEQNRKEFNDLCRFGRGAYVQTMLLGRKSTSQKSSEKTAKFSVSMLTKQLELDNMVFDNQI